MAATTTPTDAEEFYEWCQEEHGPGDDFAELVDDIVREKVASTSVATAARGAAALVLIWLDIEKVAGSVDVKDVVIGDDCFNGVAPTAGAGGAAPTQEAVLTARKKAQRRWWKGTGIPIARRTATAMRMQAGARKFSGVSG